MNKDIGLQRVDLFKWDRSSDFQVKVFILFLQTKNSFEKVVVCITDDERP